MIPSNQINIELALKNFRSYKNDPTSLNLSTSLSEFCDHQVYIKWETTLPTGAFKERGALNFLLNHLTNKNNTKSVTFCAASAGNHALGLAYHSKRLGVKCVLVMPTVAPITKVKQAEKFGAEVIIKGANFDEAKDAAFELTSSKNYFFVPAFDHEDIIAGQGTIGVELLEQLPDVDCVISPIGGGGLISGISIALKELGSKAHIVGVQSEWAVRYQKTIVNEANKFLRGTLADGIAVKVPGELTQSIIDKNVDQLVAVSENEIASAMIFFLEREKKVIEGAGAVGIIPIMKNLLPRGIKKTVVIVSGSNVDLNIISRLISREMATRSQMVKLLLTVPDRPGVLHSLSGAFAKHGANVLEVFYDRSFSYSPGDVDVTFVIEVKDLAHRDIVLKEVENLGILIKILSPSTSEEQR